MSDTAETIGFIAAILTMSCYVPQVWHTWRTKEVAAISLWMYVVLFGGISLWLIYGIMLGSWPLMLSNFVTLIMLSAIIWMKIHYSASYGETGRS